VQLGPAEILVILVVALLVFGPNRLPEVARQVGRGVREVRRFQQHIRSEIDDVLADDLSAHGGAPPRLPARIEPSDPVTQDPVTEDSGTQDPIAQDPVSEDEGIEDAPSAGELPVHPPRSPGD
jgi:TatA/E family protein of Tat protein translocase